MNALDILLIVLAVIVAAYLIWRWIQHREEYGPRIHRLPLDRMGYPHVPAVPFIIKEIPTTLIRLGLRSYATTQAKSGLNHTYTIAGTTANGYSFMYGRGTNVEAEEEKERQTLAASLENADPLELLDPQRVRARFEAAKEPTLLKASADPITNLSLEQPDQFALSWTSFNEVYANAKHLLPDWSATLTDPATAERLFWPTIAQYGLAYNLLFLQKLDPTRAQPIRQELGAAWTAQFDTLLQQGLLYAIDLRLFSRYAPQIVKEAPRFTPGTLTLLSQDPLTKALTPIAVVVMGQNGAGKQVYTPTTATTGAWLYALVAAKTSVTVYGIWIGHVWHWHIVTAAMLMTMNNTLPETHPVREFLAPQSDYVIPFDDVLLLLWKQIAPPTSFSTTHSYLQLTNDYATGRSFFEDDPHATLARHGIKAEDFTVTTPWDAYPIVGRLLSIWDAAQTYATTYTDLTYSSDAQVAADTRLQAWLAASTDPKDGNIVGLPPMDSRSNLSAVLTSLIYRLTAHGTSRLDHTADPSLTFIPNYPPCLQITEIPSPSTTISTTQLLAYLPKTGTIGEMITFYFTFAFSAPYVPLLPIAGSDTDLFYSGSITDPRNQALIRFRQSIYDFITQYTPDSPQYFQWPRNIET